LMGLSRSSSSTTSKRKRHRPSCIASGWERPTRNHRSMAKTRRSRQRISSFAAGCSVGGACSVHRVERNCRSWASLLAWACPFGTGRGLARSGGGASAACWRSACRRMVSRAAENHPRRPRARRSAAWTFKGYDRALWLRLRACAALKPDL
jgi:hypothetical protein